MAFKCVKYCRWCCHFLYMPIYIRGMFSELCAAVIWPKYCRYGVKHYNYNQSINPSSAGKPREVAIEQLWRHHPPWLEGLIFSANDRFTLVCRNIFRCSNLLSIEYNFKHNKNIFLTLRSLKDNWQKIKEKIKDKKGYIYKI